MDVVEQLEKLAELKKAHLLTDAEFESQKAKLLKGDSPEVGESIPPKRGIKKRLKSCRDCGNDIGKKAKVCPQCGSKQTSWRDFSLRNCLLAVLMVFCVKVCSKEMIIPKVASVGDTVITEQLEITVFSADQVSTVGSSGIWSSNASQGASYLAVFFSIKNRSNSPIGAFSMPKWSLEDSNHTRYEPDIGASAAFAAEMPVDAKILSDLNPGVTVKDVFVFEVATSRLKTGDWTIIVDTGHDRKIHFRSKLAQTTASSTISRQQPTVLKEKHEETTLRNANIAKSLKKSMEVVSEQSAEVVSSTDSSSIKCKDLNRDDYASYQEKVELLAMRAGIADGYVDRYQESVLGDLCNGNFEDIDSLIEHGYASAQFVDAMSKMLGVNYKIKERSQRGIAGEETRIKLLNMGMCNACAANAEMYYLDMPTSQCGRLVKQALEGNQAAVERLSNNPDYCG